MAKNGSATKTEEVKKGPGRKLAQLRKRWENGHRNAVIEEINFTMAKSLWGDNLTWEQFCDRKVEGCSAFWMEKKKSGPSRIGMKRLTVEDMKALSAEDLAKKKAKLEKDMARMKRHAELIAQAEKTAKK